MSYLKIGILQLVVEVKGKIPAYGSEGSIRTLQDESANNVQNKKTAQKSSLNFGYFYSFV